MSVFLTPLERQIAEAAARGARNREIAQVIGLTGRTVEWYLSRIYRKFGVRSRTELAARFSAGASIRRDQP